MIKTIAQQIFFVIECTFQTKHDQWQLWSDDQFASYNLALAELDRIAIAEKEFNKTSQGKLGDQFTICGFRIIQKTIIL